MELACIQDDRISNTLRDGIQQQKIIELGPEMGIFPKKSQAKY